MRTERLAKLTRTESLTLFHVLKLYGWNIYRYQKGHFLVPFKVKSYKEMMTKNFIFIEFNGESFPIIQSCVKGKLIKRDSPVKVLYSNEDIRLLSTLYNELILRNYTGEKCTQGVYEGEELCLDT